MPAALRKSAVTSQNFFPQLIAMLTEVEIDEASWLEASDNQDMLGTDVYSTAVSAITRFSKDIGEKKTLESV